MTNLLPDFTAALADRWTGIYLRFLALVLFYGALMHVGNIVGWSGRPWLETPLLWRVMDGVLLTFDLIVGVGLWLKQPWSPIALVVGLIALQGIPYTLFRQYFVETPEQAATLNSLLGTEAILLAILLGLLVWPRA